MASTLVQWIDRQPWFHAVVRGLRLRALVSRLLHIRPVTRTFPSGARVEASDLESFYLGDEIFQRECYRPALARAGQVRTVVDLGCNIGFFCCYLRHYFQRADFTGLAIDANPAVLQRAKRNLQLNDLHGIELLQGLVGATHDKPAHEFYLYASHLGSSQFIQPETGKTLKGGWKRIDVPALNPGEIWRARHGDMPIDLLKIDIEGSEGRLLQTDPDLFRQTKCLVLEWHQWLVPGEEIFPVLRGLGFTRQEALDRGANTELWLFSRD